MLLVKNKDSVNTEADKDITHTITNYSAFKRVGIFMYFSSISIMERW